MPEETMMKAIPFVVMVKPVGSQCNMQCDYCYYLKTEYDVPVRKMTESTLRILTEKVIRETPGEIISFTWHGGEPMLAGLDFYRQAVKIQKEYLPHGKECWNNLQTNGTLMTEEWAAFLQENHFDVGLSMDGTAQIHNRYRHFASGEETYSKSERAVELLLKHGIRPDLLCTVTEETAQNGREVYRNLRAKNTGWIQFIPIVVRREDGTLSEESVRSESYGEFLKDVFAEWFFQDYGRIGVQMFAEMISVLSGGSASLCWMAETCGNVLVVESSGEIYSCDHFVDRKHRIGSVLEDSFQQILSSPFQRDFGLKKKTALGQKCLNCQFLPFCHGGCQKDRFSDGTGENYLCKGLESFFEYAVPRLSKAESLRRGGMNISDIRKKMVSEERERYSKVKRNDLCPCGSGKKLKNCCINRIP